MSSHKIPIVFVSMKRGGQHAIINWFANQMVEDVHHYNCCHFHNENEIIPTRGDWIIEYRGGQKIDFLKTGRRKTVDMTILPQKQLIINFEDYYVKDVVNKLKFKEYVLIVIVRDAYNMFASTLKWVRKNDNEHGRYYVENHKERIEKLIEHYSYVDNHINYNKWVVDKTYRDVMCAKYGMINTDKGFEEVTSFGSGSSFDEQKYTDNATEMNVLERYKGFLDDEEYLKMIDDERLKNLTHKCFNIKL